MATPEYAARQSKASAKLFMFLSPEDYLFKLLLIGDSGQHSCGAQ